MIEWPRYLLLISLLSAGGCASHPQADGQGEGALRVRLERADLALREARMIDAEVLYRELTETHPRLPEVWLQLGNIYTRQAQLEAAMRTYRGGLRYAQNDGRLWHNLALVELKQALLTLETANEVLPPDNVHAARIQQLHRSLIAAGNAGTERTETSSLGGRAP